MTSWKQLVAGVVLILVVGLGAFFYRNILEHPAQQKPAAVACTQEAKICPNGSSVGRQGPNCAFAACAFPNVEDAAIGISFVVPAGYAANPDAIGADETLRAVFDKPSKSDVPQSIIIRRYPIPEGKTADETILANTMFESSGMVPTSFDKFKQVTIGGRTYRNVVLERFEGVIHSAYYLAREHDVLKFEVIERPDADWTDPKLDISALPEHKALIQLLSTLQSS